VRDKAFVTLLAAVTILVVVLGALGVPERMAAGLLGDVAPQAVEAKDQLFQGTVVLDTPNGTYLATVLYARGEAQVRGLEAAVNLTENVSRLPAEVGEPLRSTICQQYDCNETRRSGDDILANLSRALSTLGSEAKAKLLGNATAQVSSGADFMLVVKVVRAEKPEASGAMPETAAAVATTGNLTYDLCGRAKANATPEAAAQMVCVANPPARTLLASWNLSLALYSNLSRPADTAVFGPLSWRTAPENATVDPRGVPGSGGPFLPKGAKGSLFLPTSALLWASVGILSGLVVNPIARRAGWDPFLPVPLLAALLGLGMLVAIHHGHHVGPAWTTTLLLFAPIYAAILLVYAAGGASFFHLFSGWLTLAGLAVGGYLLLHGVLDLYAASPTALIARLYDGPAVTADFAKAATDALAWGGTLVVLGLLITLVGSIWAPLERLYDRASARWVGPRQRGRSWPGEVSRLRRRISRRRSERRTLFGVPRFLRDVNVFHPGFWAEAAEWNHIRRSARYANRYRPGLKRRFLLKQRPGGLATAAEARTLEQDIVLVSDYVDAVRATRTFRGLVRSPGEAYQ